MRTPIRRAAERMRGRRRLRAHVREFLLADTALPRGAGVRTIELLPAVVTYLRVGHRFRRAGLAAALRCMPALRRTHRTTLAQPAAAFCARSAAGRVLGIARTLGGRHLCLHESVAMTAALRQLGFPAQVVVGYPVIESADGSEELHAWPQVGDATVTDRLGSAPLNFVELIRFPREGEDPAARALTASSSGAAAAPAQEVVG